VVGRRLNLFYGLKNLAASKSTITRVRLHFNDKTYTYSRGDDTVLRFVTWLKER
jgi:hypothetical protein